MAWPAYPISYFNTTLAGHYSCLRVTKLCVRAETSVVQMLSHVHVGWK